MRAGFALYSYFSNRSREKKEEQEYRKKLVEQRAREEAESREQAIIKEEQARQESIAIEIQQRRIAMIEMRQRAEAERLALEIKNQEEKASDFFNNLVKKQEAAPHDGIFLPDYGVISCSAVSSYLDFLKSFCQEYGNATLLYDIFLKGKFKETSGKAAEGNSGAPQGPKKPKKPKTKRQKLAAFIKSTFKVSAAAFLAAGAVVAFFSEFHSMCTGNASNKDKAKLAALISIIVSASDECFFGSFLSKLIPGGLMTMYYQGFFALGFVIYLSYASIQTPTASQLLKKIEALELEQKNLKEEQLKQFKQLKKEQLEQFGELKEEQIKQFKELNQGQKMQYEMQHEMLIKIYRELKEKEASNNELFNYFLTKQNQQRDTPFQNIEEYKNSLDDDTKQASQRIATRVARRKQIGSESGSALPDTEEDLLEKLDDLEEFSSLAED